MALARLDRWEWLKNVLTENAYRRFFNATMDNIQAGHDGRDFRIGRQSTDDVRARSILRKWRARAVRPAAFTASQMPKGLSGHE